MMDLPYHVLNAVNTVLLNPKDFTPLHTPNFKGNELKYVSECISTGWVSSVGQFVDQFELDLAKFCGVERAVAVVNGTAALHISLLIAGVKPEDEVIIPSLTFVATANAVKYAGAHPHFVDVEESTFGIDANKLKKHLHATCELRGKECYNKKTGRRIACIVPMHTFGHPTNMDALMKVSEEFGLPIVEDAAESLGSYYKGVHTGGIGLVSAMSFNGNKIMTTGGGGAILTNSEKLADIAKHLTTTAKQPSKWEFKHDEIGFNYRMPNLNAALGVAQIESMPDFVNAKRDLANRYKNAFEGLEGVTFVEEPENSKSNYWLCTCKLDSEDSKQLENLLELLNSNNIMARPIWNPLHQLKIYEGEFRADLEVTKSLAKRVFNLPSSTFL